MLAFKALHILTMFAAVTVLAGEALFIGAAIWRGDVRALAAIRRVTGRRPVLGSGLFLLGIVFGLLAALTGPLDLLAGWLIAAYVLVGAIFAVNLLPVVQKGLLGLSDKAAEADAGRLPAEDVVDEMMALRRPVAWVVAANLVLFAALILDMVLKPF